MIMKKLILSFIALSLVVGANSQSFSVETNDTTYYGTPFMSDFFGDVDVINLAGISKQMVWIEDSVNMPSAWDYSMCDQSVCHPIGTTADIWTLPGASGYLNIHFYPNGMAGEGFVRIHVYDYLNPTDETWITFRGSAVSTSTVEVAIDKVSAYPNPFNSILSITGLEIGMKYKVVDLLGKTIINKTVTSSHKDQMDMSDIKAGTYFFILQSGEKMTTTKLIKL